MTEYSLYQTLRSLLAATTVGGSTAFTQVVVSYASDPVLVSQLSHPSCIIVPGACRSDPDFGEEPSLHHADVVVRVLATIPGDAVGEAAVMGANQTGGTKGYGVLRLAQVVRDVLSNLSPDDGITIKNVTSGAGQGGYVDESRYLGYRDVQFTAVFTDS